MAQDHIRYDILVQEAMRGVVRKVLSEVAKTGLPGDHHFFISFVTQAPGVRLSQKLISQYDKEMTIVLQNQYWDLKVSETGFEVGLSFDGVNEILLIPFSAIKGFFDPSVQFGLQFEVAEPKAGPRVVADPDDDSEQDIEQPGEAEDPAAEDSGEKVVSLDSFRKK